jgi:hypothetical protein
MLAKPPSFRIADDTIRAYLPPQSAVPLPCREQYCGWLIAGVTHDHVNRVLAPGGPLIIQADERVRCGAVTGN